MFGALREHNMWYHHPLLGEKHIFQTTNQRLMFVIYLLYPHYHLSYPLLGWFKFNPYNSYQND